MLKPSDQFLEQEQRETYRQLFDLSVDPMWMIYDGKFISANMSAASMLGYGTPDKLTKVHPSQLSPEYQPDGVSSFVKANEMMSIAYRKGFHRFEWVHLDKNHRAFPVEVSLTRVPYKDKEGLFCVWRDISERKAAEEKLRLSARVFTSTHDGVIVTDAEKNIIDVNPAFCEITGYSCEEVIGQNPQILSSGKQSSEFYAAMWQKINEEQHWQGEIWNRKKNGEVYAELLTLSALEDSNGNITNYVGIFSDITGSKRQQEKLNLLAHYDVLTKLPNRILFSDRFQQAIAHSKRSEALLAVCFLDLDDFKPINDNFGHEIGDQLLIEVANRIKSCIRSEDTVARLGGDEFSLLLSDIVSSEQCKGTIARIHKVLAKPFIIDDITHNITVSTGITLYPQDNGDADTLLRHADQAMYLAKQSGRNCFRLFNVEEEQRKTQKNYRLVEINDALENDELCLYYQPKVNMATGEVFGVEALLRWLSPEKGLIPPLDFLPVIKGTSLEIKVGEWVIDTALAQLESWQEQNINLEMSINVSSHHLLSISFIDSLEQTLAKYPTVSSNLLQVEVLESSVFSDIKMITDIIETCRTTLGVSFALDDFGTGYSSLTHLRNLPVNLIKIDQTFVRDMLDDPYDYTIVDGVISLAKAFGRDVLAEGVETIEQGWLLLVLGCKKAQGFGISKPINNDEFLSWLKNYKPNKSWLHCKVKNLSRNEKKIKIFRLTSGQWVRRFISNLRLSEEAPHHWPIMDKYNNPCSHWLKQEKKEQSFDKGWLHTLRVADEKIYTIAEGLLEQYQSGHYEKARAGIEELESAFTDMDYILEHHK